MIDAVSPGYPLANGQFPGQQQGATLIVALVMLLLISLLAIGGMQGSIMQERMASNAHDGALSFQASEAALRQAEDDILNSLPTRLTAFDEPLIATPSWALVMPARMSAHSRFTTLPDWPMSARLNRANPALRGI